MTRPQLRLSLVSILLLLAVAAAAGCSSKAQDDTDEDGAALKTGPGVSSNTIKLGLLTDLSGVFAPLGEPITQGTQLFWDRQNKRGGVCNRKVELLVQDHGYDPQKAVSLYRSMEPDILALQQLLGSPVAAALLSTVERDGLLAALAAWPSSLLPNANVQITGTTYAPETANALAYLEQERLVERGDTVGHVYLDGEYGEDALAGSEYAAQQLGLKLVRQQVVPTDRDLSAQVSAFKRAGVDAIVSSGSPTQTASLVGVAASQKLDVPIVSNEPGFDASLMKSPAADALAKHLLVVSSISPASLDKPAVQDVSQAYESAYRKPASFPVQYGYAIASVTHNALERACKNGDLTRQGVVDALRQLSKVDLGGLVAGPLDYAAIGDAPTRSVYIAKPDAEAVGGLRAVTDDGFNSELADRYRFSQQ